MSFVVYFAVVLVAAASALFGLDLLTAPLPPKPPNPVAVAASPGKAAQREAEKEKADKQANSRALSPVFPASPGESKDARMAQPPGNETTGAEDAAPARAEPRTGAQAASAPQPQQSQESAPTAPQATAAAPAITSGDTGVQSTAAAAPTDQVSGLCDIQACASRYQSFRPSDCTYQPFSGPRRVCGTPGQRRATTAARPRGLDARAERATREWDARPWDSRRNPELDDAVRGARPRPNDDADFTGLFGGRRSGDRGGWFWR